MIHRLNYYKNFYKAAAKAYLKAGKAHHQDFRYRKFGLLNPSIASGNLGDLIIEESVKRAVRKIDDEAMLTEFPTQLYLSFDAKVLMEKQDLLLLGGTNLLSSNLDAKNQWKIDKSYSRYVKKKVVLIGCGWWQYQDKANRYTTAIYKSLLSKNILHSVRDQYTAEKLMEAGIRNVVNTSCPTLWSLTPEHCLTVRQKKSPNVVTTLTSYKKDIIKDQYLVNKLLENYEKVYVWIQGIEDLSYLNGMTINTESIVTIPPTLDAYDRLLSNGGVDYIGTRLHAGVRAIQHKVRTLVVAVDNRATEIGKDVNLNVIPRDRVEAVVDFIEHDYATKIDLPTGNIQAWLRSVERGVG